MWHGSATVSDIFEELKRAVMSLFLRFASFGKGASLTFQGSMLRQLRPKMRLHNPGHNSRLTLAFFSLLARDCSLSLFSVSLFSKLVSTSSSSFFCKAGTWLGTVWVRVATQAIPTQHSTIWPDMPRVIHKHYGNDQSFQSSC